MAKVKNSLGVHGKVGEFSIYKLNGKWIMRKNAQIEKKRFNEDKGFLRMRENMVEFGLSSEVGKLIRTMFAPYSRLLADAYVSGRLVGAVKKVVNKGDGKRGERSFRLGNAEGVLTWFEFNGKKRLEDSFKVPLNVAVNGDRNEARLLINSFNAKEKLKCPKGTTHFRVVCGAGVLSDCVYDEVRRNYKIVNRSKNGKFGIVKTDFIRKQGVVAGIDLVCGLDGIGVLPGSCGLLVCAGVEFYEEVNGAYYFLENTGGFKVVGIY